MWEVSGGRGRGGGHAHGGDQLVRSMRRGPAYTWAASRQLRGWWGRTRRTAPYSAAAFTKSPFPASMNG